MQSIYDYIDPQDPTSLALELTYQGHLKYGYCELTIKGVKYVVVRSERYNSERTLLLEEVEPGSNRRVTYVKTESGWRYATEHD